MNQNDRLYQLGMKAWEFRKQAGFSKALPEEFRKEAAECVHSGLTQASVARSMGVSKATILEWSKKYAKADASLESGQFSEVQITEGRPRFEVRLSTTVQGCKVELTGTDFSLLQRLLRKLGGS